MRARWDFKIECTGVRFDRVHNYEAQITKEHAKEIGLGEAFSVPISIAPDEKSYSPLIEQTGKLKITLPGDKDQTEDLAFWLARHVAQQVTFSQGEMKVNYGLVLGEHLPETPEEVEQIGDKPFFAKVQLIEALPTPTFDGSSIQKVSSNPLIQQFNAADGAKNPIDKFLGLFKILEDLYGPTSAKTKLADSLKASSELFNLARQHLHITEKGIDRTLTNEDFSRLVAKLVKTRHECAHLRSSKHFGITHGHPRVNNDVEPLIVPLRELAFKAVQRRL